VLYNILEVLVMF